MAFTVGLPGGARDYEYEAYVRLLEKDGVDIAHTPRVHDPRTGNRWLYVWADRDDAERFTDRLREETGNPDWEVYELPDSESSEGPLGPIEILVGRQSDGYAYDLRPTSRKLIRRRFPQARLMPGLFISAETRNDFDSTQGPVLDQVAQILTGLSSQQIDELGGYRVYEATSRQVLREAPEFVH